MSGEVIGLIMAGLLLLGLFMGASAGLRSGRHCRAGRDHRRQADGAGHRDQPDLRGSAG